MSTSSPQVPPPLFPISRWRAALYLLLPNDIVWSRLLDSRERDLLLWANICNHDTREDFTPEKYQNGNCFDSDASRSKHVDGKWIVRFLEAHKPRSVLECGPGSGFHTRSIVDQPGLERYVGVEVSRNFVDYLRLQLAPYRERAGLDFQIHLMDVKQLECPPVDAVVFSSSLHHIPDRQDIFMKITQLVKPGGHIFCIEPTHYLPRLRHLWRKVAKPGYLRGMCDGSILLGTHHFCTWREFKRLSATSGALRVSEVEYDGYQGSLIPRLISRLARLLGIGWPVWLRTSFPIRLFSTRMMITFERL